MQNRDMRMTGTYTQGQAVQALDPKTGAVVAVGEYQGDYELAGILWTAIKTPDAHRKIGSLTFGYPASLVRPAPEPESALEQARRAYREWTTKYPSFNNQEVIANLVAAERRDAELAVPGRWKEETV